jgi:cell division protein ZapA
MADSSGIRVVIYDQVYHIRPAEGADPRQVERLAGYVDSRMRAIAAQTRDVDSLRVAVLAALHIADEYDSLKARFEALKSAVDRKSAEFARLLDSEIRRAIG